MRAPIALDASNPVRPIASADASFTALAGELSELPGSGDLDLLAACGIATLTFRRFLDFELPSWSEISSPLAATLLILFSMLSAIA